MPSPYSRLILVFFVLCLSTSCQSSNSNNDEYNAEIYSMDTIISLRVWGDNGNVSIQDCENFIYSIEDRFSTTRENSTIYRLNRSDDWISVSQEMADVLSFAITMTHQTQGAFNPSIYPLVTAWGFTLDQHIVPDSDTIDSLLPLIDIEAVHLDSEKNQVRLEENVQLDLGAIAKGYTADRVADLLRSNGHSSALISLGGNIYAVGKKVDGSLWNIGIKNPYGGGTVCSVYIEDKAVVTSGGYQRYFIEEGETYWHIIDPRTGYPAKAGLASVSIVSDSAMYGDVLSTALFVMGLEEATEYWRTHQDFEAILICDEGDVFITSGLLEQFAMVSTYTTGELKVIYP